MDEDDSMDDVGGFDAVEDSAQGGTGSSTGGGVGDSVGEGSGYGDTFGVVEDIGLPNDSVDSMIARGIDPALETVTPTSFMGISITPNSAYEDELENTEIGNYTDASGMMHGISVTDSFGGDGSAAFPSMYDPAPPVVEPPVIDPITQPGPTISPEDSILFHFTPRERRSYLVNQIEMGMEPTRGYTGPDGVFVDLTAIYPDIFYPDQVFTQPMLPMSGGGYVDDYRMNRGGIMDLREPHRYNRGGNVMRNIRDEQARVIGVQDDAADQMNRIRYHSGRDARDERFRVAARERDARAEMGRLRGEARYEDMHGRGPRLFNQGGVASLAPVARNMFRKRRLPRAGMVV